MPMVRRESVGDDKVEICDSKWDILSTARSIASARSLEGRDEAFLLVSIDALVDRLALWRRHLPMVEPHFAVKVNPDEVVIRCLAALGVGFDCASREELETVLRMGVTPERIIYAHPCKMSSYIKFANDRQVNLMTFDNAEELMKIVDFHSSPELILRIAVSDPTAQSPLGRKFGAEPVEKAPELLRIAAEMGLSIKGISFHVGSGCNDSLVYRRAIEHARRLFDIGMTLGHQMDILDIGGGFPGTENPNAPFEKIASIIRCSLDEFFPDPSVRVIAELGRFFATRPFTLVTSVMAATAVSADNITKKEEDSSSTGYMYYLNDGVYGTFNCILIDAAKPVGQPLFEGPGPCFPSTLWGPTCDSIDLIEDNKKMRRLGVGEWLIYRDMGAYSAAVATGFNGFQKPNRIYVMKQRTWALQGM